MKPSITYYISLPHAVAMIKKMHTKKQRNAGYHFELEEYPDQNLVWNKPDKMFYADYKWTTTIYELKIFYENPCPQKN